MRRVATWSATSGKDIQILRPEFKGTRQKWCVKVSVFYPPNTVFDESGKELDGDHRTIRVRKPQLLSDVARMVEEQIAELTSSVPSVREATSEYFA